MYVHAYQSYIWNSAVSERIRLLGCKSPVPGDLVMNEPVEGAEDGAAEETAEVDTPVSNGRKTQESLMAVSKVPKVKVLTEEDVSQYTIYDVVLPLPGYSVAYPAGTIGDLYKKMLEADGLDINKLFRPQKCVFSDRFSLSC